ncbi:hypothetical protein [Parageobacillus sp. KH3-4]|uniref:hypothetical protein n=1 Tax=Parageobacillus sp. KH3-4 TaxID=2916802 RepID=UPI001FCABAB2|nr:hypothetical protein [Parageobacillus sp. KH3-4]BDG48763.1 hypothetical protein PspKH34_33240 [Parageobacillus sp. KH3-4]
MAATPKRLYIGQPGTSLETLYTVPTNTKTIVKQIVLSNTTGTDANVTIHFVPNGQVAGNGNKIFSALTVTANNTGIFDLSAVLEAGDTIQAVQGTANAITIHISGVEVN